MLYIQDVWCILFFLYINMITYKMFICVHKVYIHTQSYTYVVIWICSPVYMSIKMILPSSRGSVEITSPQDRNVCPEAATRAVAWSRWVEGTPNVLVTGWAVSYNFMFCRDPGKTLFFSLERNWDRHFWQKPTVFLKWGSRMSKVPCSMMLPVTVSNHVYPFVTIFDFWSNCIPNPSFWKLSQMNTTTLQSSVLVLNKKTIPSFDQVGCQVISCFPRENPYTNRLTCDFAWFYWFYILEKPSDFAPMFLSEENWRRLPSNHVRTLMVLHRFIHVPGKKNWCMVISCLAIVFEHYIVYILAFLYIYIYIHMLMYHCWW